MQQPFSSSWQTDSAICIDDVLAVSKRRLLTRKPLSAQLGTFFHKRMYEGRLFDRRAWRGDTEIEVRRMTEMFALLDRVALVTGASYGLGLEIAAGLAASGAHVILHGRDAARLRQAENGLRKRCSDWSLETCAFDLSDEQLTANAVTALIEHHGRVDILVNNAGARDRRPLQNLSRQAVRSLLEVDLVAPIDLVRLLVPHVPDGGRIINVSSIAGQIARSDDAAYTAAKGGLEAVTRALAAELGTRRITVNAVAPGYFATEANRSMVEDSELTAYLARRTALGRWGDPRELAGAVVFLASHAASYITGHVLAVDGGYLSHF